MIRLPDNGPGAVPGLTLDSFLGQRSEDTDGSSGPFAYLKPQIPLIVEALWSQLQENGFEIENEASETRAREHLCGFVRAAFEPDGRDLNTDAAFLNSLGVPPDAVFGWLANALLGAVLGPEKAREPLMFELRAVLGQWWRHRGRFAAARGADAIEAIPCQCDDDVVQTTEVETAAPSSR